MLLARKKTEAFETVNPVYAIEDDKVIFKDGRVGIGFVVHSPEMETWSRPLYEQAQSTLAGLFKHLPTHTILQKTDVYYHVDSIKLEAEDKFFTTKQKQKFLDQQVLHHKSYLFLSFAPAKAKKVVEVNAFNALVVRAGEALKKNPFAEVPDTLELAARSAFEVMSTLRSLSGVAVEQLKEDDLNSLYAQYFNLNFHQPAQTPNREISNTRAGLLVGEHMVNVVSMTGQSAQAVPVVANTYNVVSPMVYSLTHFLNFPHITTQAVMVTDTRKELKSLDNDLTINNSLGSVLGSQDNELRVEELKHFTAEVRAGNKSLTKLHVSVTIWEHDNALRKERIDLILTAFRLMFDAEAVVESAQALHMFFGLLPGNANQIPDRWIVTSADRAACYLHWTTTYRSDTRGDLICDRFNQLVRINLFNTTHQNMNGVIIGPSGSGKSYTYGYFIVQRHERGNRQILIDNGGTYRNVVKFLTGPDFDQCYHDYDPEHPMAFNPFLVPRDENGQWLYNSEKQLYHLALFALLLKKPLPGQTGVSLSKPEEALISKMLISYYKHLNQLPGLATADELFPGMQSFYDYVKQRDQKLTKDDFDKADEPLGQERSQYAKDESLLNMHEFFTIIEQFVSGGRYAAVFNARYDKDLSDHQLICFDLKRVKEDPTLYPVVGLLITQLSIDQFAKYPDADKHIALDEAWSLLSGLQEFIESMYRTIRKLNGSITIITQSSADIVTSPIAAAIIANTNNLILLRHKPGPGLERLQADMGLSAHEMDLMRSLRVLPDGQGQEVFIKQESRGKVYSLSAALELDPILTSTAWQRNYLNRLIAAAALQQRIIARDQAGRLILDDQGRVTYYMIEVPRMKIAVEQYMEAKATLTGPFAL